MTDGSDPSPKSPDRTLRTGDGLPKLPSVDALVGANAPCDPIPPPPEHRQWDSSSGRWIRPGPPVPPDPAGITYPPSEVRPDGLKPLDISVEDPADVAVPRWAVGLVAVMFGVGIAVGLLFAIL